MNSKKRRHAFSLIELSIVIIIIGILIAGVTQGSRMIDSARLQNARNLTESSPIASIKDLVSWWETTSESSFSDSESDDSSSVSTWYDINPQSVRGFDLTQTVTDDKPVLKDGVINNLPALYFNGSSSYFRFDNKAAFNSKEMTIFAIVKLIGLSNNGVIISSRATSPLRGYILYASPGATDYYEFWTGTGSTWVGENDSTMEVLLEKRELISVTNDSSTVTMYKNGENLHSQSQAISLNTSTDLRVGAGRNESTPHYFIEGYMGELVIFDRVLKTRERQDIEEYLGQKWGIDLVS